MKIDITQIVISLLGIVSAILTTFIIPWLKDKTKSEEMKVVLDIATQVVYAAQELKITEELKAAGITKADYAWTQAKQALLDRHICISDEELKMYIRPAVTQLRKEIEW